MFSRTLTLHIPSRSARAERGARRPRAAVVLLAVALGLGSGVALRPYVPVCAGVVQGQSMAPALRSGQLFLLDRTYYRRHRPASGDVVMVNWRGELMIKRIHAVGGQRLALLCSARPDQTEATLIAEPSRASYYPALVRRFPSVWRIAHLQVPRGYVYVVGDNAPCSYDSRSFGPIPEERIVGRVRPLFARGDVSRP